MKGVKHENIAKIPHNKTSGEDEMDILALFKGYYNDFNLTHFKKMIEVRDAYSVSWI
jgi:hypothetical protein